MHFPNRTHTHARTHTTGTEWSVSYLVYNTVYWRSLIHCLTAMTSFLSVFFFKHTHHFFGGVQACPCHGRTWLHKCTVWQRLTKDSRSLNESMCAFFFFKYISIYRIVIRIKTLHYIPVKDAPCGGFLERRTQQHSPSTANVHQDIKLHECVVEIFRFLKKLK